MARLVEQLTPPHTSEAYLIHTGRPRVTSTVTSHGIPVDQLSVMVIKFLNTAELPESAVA